MNAAAWFCLGLPLLAAVAITLAGTRISRRGAAYLSTLTTMGAFAAAIVAFASDLNHRAGDRIHTTTSWTWLSAGKYHFGLTLLTDQLSLMMMLIVTGVGSLIIAYSIGYMDGEDEERRFFAYMSLFVFSMLLLVQSDNLLLLLAGWGMVGLSSYLLIGFHQDRPSAIAAAKKAFVMNAFGDATMVLALFLLIEHTGHLDFAGAFARSPHGGTTANLIALGLLGGAAAKSAQIPLHTWLPDAMEGPTPVSALIHAATMVTAGVYLLVRCHPLFEFAPKIGDLAAGLGAATLVMAGLIALVQNDIKRVIAYSTMSQIGYMFVGAAGGAYANGMFHLMTHAFFKALLFLAAGLVIHALAGEQDIRKMTGIGRLMPHTRTVFLIGCLALVGIPPFAGFFSKDSIIAAMLSRGGAFGVLMALGLLIGAFLTGLYTFRLFFIVFTGEPSEHARGALPCARGQGGPALDGLARDRVGSARDGRRLPPVRALLDSAHGLAAPGRRAVRDRDRPPGARRLRRRGALRPRRDRRRLGAVRREDADGAPGDAARIHPRAQVLLRRDLRLRLLQDRRCVLVGPPAARRAAADRRLDRAGDRQLRLRLA